MEDSREVSDLDLGNVKYYLNSGFLLRPPHVLSCIIFSLIIQIVLPGIPDMVDVLLVIHNRTGDLLMSIITFIMCAYSCSCI